MKACNWLTAARGRLACVLLVLAACTHKPISAQDRAAAQQIWDERCARCHGTSGLGDGLGASMLPVRPRALADSAWQASVDDAHIAKVIVDGGKPLGLDANMAANPDLKSRPEVLRALVEHVRALAP